MENFKTIEDFFNFEEIENVANKVIEEMNKTDYFLGLSKEEFEEIAFLLTAKKLEEIIKGGMLE